MLQIAIAAGAICGGIVVAYFVALDQFRAATANGGHVAAPQRTFVKQLEMLLRPVSRMPARTALQVRHKLSQAGNPGNLTPAGFQAVRYSLAALLAIAGLALGLLFPLGLPNVVAALLWGAVSAVLGFIGPSLWLEQRIGRRRHQIQRSLAEATDLLTLVVESGMSLDEGMLSITERFHNALGDEIGKVLREIARLLRVQATEMRRRQRQGAQERAAQASSRMVFPMVGCIFPVLWVVLLGPAIIQVLASLR